MAGSVKLLKVGRWDIHSPQSRQTEAWWQQTVATTEPQSVVMPGCVHDVRHEGLPSQAYSCTHPALVQAQPKFSVSCGHPHPRQAEIQEHKCIRGRQATAAPCVHTLASDRPGVYPPANHMNCILRTVSQTDGHCLAKAVWKRGGGVKKAEGRGGQWCSIHKREESRMSG